MRGLGYLAELTGVTLSILYKRRCEFCLGLSLIFSNIFPSPVPYLSLNFHVNFDRLSLKIRIEVHGSHSIHMD